MRRALGPRSALGKLVRSLRVAHYAGGAVFVHAGLWPHESAVRPDGPLWDRTLAKSRQRDLAETRIVRSRC